MSTSDKKNYYDKVINRRLNLLAYSDGKKNIFEISKTLNEPLEEIIYELKLLKKNGLLEFK